MTPKEKAKELYNKFNHHVLQRDFFGDDVEKTKSKQCALIAVYEMLEELSNEDMYPKSNYIFWEQVKQEIELL